MTMSGLPVESLDYELRLMTTRSATGYFTPVLKVTLKYREV